MCVTKWRWRIFLGILFVSIFLLVVVYFRFCYTKTTVAEQTFTDDLLLFRLPGPGSIGILSLNQTLEERRANHLPVRMPRRENIRITSLKRTLEGKGANHLSSRPPGIESIGIPSLKRALEAKGANERIKMLAKLIFKAHKHSRGSKTSDYLNAAISIMDDILIDMDIEPDEVYTRPHKAPTSVCPETYNARDFSYPFYYGGFETTNCGNAVPMYKLITVVKYISLNTDKSHFSSVDDVMKFIMSVNATYKNVKLLIALNSVTFSKDLKVEYPWVKINKAKYANEGSALNSLIEQVTTPYVLVAGTADKLTNDTRVERLIREIESLDVVAAGGAYRDQHGYWRKGCHQTVYRNFTLKYMDGYDSSFHECLFCDFIQGPFVTKTSYLKQNKFQGLDDDRGLFEDWFLQIFQKGQETVVCPDSMFNINTVPRKISNSNWKYFLERWNLHTIHTPKGDTFSLICGSLKKLMRTQALSPCTLQIMNDAVTVITKACDETGVMYELHGGTAVGAIKMGKTLPWDTDFDVRFLATNCTKCKNLEPLLKKAGLSFHDFVPRCCAIKQRQHYSIRYKGLLGDFNAGILLDSDLLNKTGVTPTKVLFNGQWVSVPRNPGLFVRNRYGKEVYQHAEHWRNTGAKNKHALYTTNLFLPCVNPGRHECLDRYNADGTLQFIDMLP